MNSSFPPPGFTQAPSKVEGIEVYVPSGPNLDHPEVVDFKCPRCGATTAYNVNVHQVACEHCGYTELPQAQQLGRAAEKFEFKVDTVERAQQGWGIERKDLSCQRCGALVSVPPELLAYACPFCGSNKVLLRETLQDVLRPRFLIPFKVDPQNCRLITQQWLGSSWMLPAQLTSTVRLSHFAPIYLPYWTFSAVCKAQWKAQVGKEVREYYYINGERHERTRIEWHWESGRVERAFNDLLVPGTGQLHLNTLAKIDNFNISDLVAYEPHFLAGMQAQAYDITLEQAWDAGRQVMRDRTRQACRDRISSGHVRNFSMSLDFNDESWRYILVPIYTSVYTFHEKTFQILINGQTGKIAGPRPVDWQKVWLAIAALIAPGSLLGLVGLVTLILQIGVVIGGIGLFLLLVGLVISFILFMQAQEMERA